MEDSMIKNMGIPTERADEILGHIQKFYNDSPAVSVVLGKIKETDWSQDEKLFACYQLGANLSAVFS